MTLATQADFARDIGVARSRITALKNAGRLVMEGDRVDVEKSKAKIAESRDPSRDHQSPQPPRAPEAPAQDDRIGNSYQAARAVKERYLALDAKRSYELACGQLMRADDVASSVAAAATTLRTRLESFPEVLSVSLSMPMDESQRRAVIADAVETLLAGLAADFKKLTETTP